MDRYGRRSGQPGDSRVPSSVSSSWSCVRLSYCLTPDGSRGLNRMPVNYLHNVREDCSEATEIISGRCISQTLQLQLLLFSYQNTDFSFYKIFSY